MGARRGTRARPRPHGRRTDGRTGHAPLPPGRDFVPDPGPSAGRDVGDLRHPGHPGIGVSALAGVADPCDPARCRAAPILHCGTLGHASAPTARHSRRRPRARHQPPAVAGGRPGRGPPRRPRLQHDADSPRPLHRRANAPSHGHVPRSKDAADTHATARRIAGGRRVCARNSSPICWKWKRW